MHVVVCIVGYRNAADIVACLGALGNSTYRDFEVRICENGGPQAYSDVAAAVPKSLPAGQPVAVTEAATNLGYAGGINTCMRASEDADAWWILNPDTLPEPTALEALVGGLAQGHYDAVGGVLHGPDNFVQTLGGRWRPWLARAEAIGRGLPLARVTPSGVDVSPDFISGACMLVGKAFVDRAGLMREDYFLYCEEVEWCLRGRARGLRLGVAAAARVLHDQGGTTGSARPRRSRPRLPVYLDERNKMLVTRDCFPARLPVAALAALLLIGLRFTARGAWRQSSYALHGWWDGLLGKRGAVPPA